MADRAGAGGNTSLRGLRERMVAAAHAIAEERRSQSGFSSLPSQSSNIRSAFKPVIDGSVLKNDIKQRLARERREERKRQQDANKEIQLLEKERKSKIQYEKQMEEKQRKLREQKEKDEQRRVSAEEKRKQKLQEEREKFKAVVYRTLERSNRVDRQKRWSWEGSTAVNSEGRTANRRSISTEKLERETSGLHKQMSTSSSGLQNSVAKKKTEKRSSSLNRRYSKLNSSTETEQVEAKPVARYLYSNVRENNLITRLLAPTKASIARSRSAASLSVPGKDTPGIHNTLIQYINMPLHSHSRDELKNTIVLCKSTGAMLPQEKGETSSEVSLEAPTKVSVEVSPKTSLEVAPKASVEAPLHASMETPPEVSVEAPPKASMEATPKASVEATPEPSVEASPESVESPEVSMDSCPEMSVDPSPEVSMDSSLEVNMEMSSETSLGTSPEASIEASPKTSVEALPRASLETLSEASGEVSPEASMEGSSEASGEVSPKASVEALPKESMEASSEASGEVSPEATSVEALPTGSMEASSEASVEVSPEASVEALPKASMEASPEASMEALPKASVEASPEASMEVSPHPCVEALPKASVEASSETSVEVSPEASVEAPPEVSPEVSVETSSKVKVRDSPQKSEMDKQASNSVTKKRPSLHIPCYRRSSSASGLRPPSPISARQVQKNRPPSPSPIMSKQSGQSSSYKMIPVQRTLFAQNALSTMGRKREAISKTTNSSEAMSQKHMTYEESGNKSTPGTMNAEEATKILAEKRRLAREQREKEGERLQKEMEQRKVKDVAKKTVEGQEEEFSKSEDEQLQKEIKKKKECQDQEDQEVLLQKGDAKIKAQEEADKRKKEHERIMLQNMQERLERKKRIEEIMKRTRKTDSNASKTTETSGNDMYEEEEADDEDESESDEDSSDDMDPSDFINGMNSSTKLKTHFKNVKNTPKLVFLDATSSQVRKETKTRFNGDMKTFGQKSVQDPFTQEEGIRLSTKRTTSREAKTGKTKETSNTMGPSRSLPSQAQEWVCENSDIVSMAEPLMSSIPPDSEKHHLKGSMTFHQSPQTRLDNKKRNKSVSAQSDK